MSKYTTPTKKEKILETIIQQFNEAKDECEKFPSDRYYVGRYVALSDLLKVIKIYEKENDYEKTDCN